MNRREFARLLGMSAALAGKRCLAQAGGEAVLEVDTEAAPTPVAVDFTAPPPFEVFVGRFTLVFEFAAAGDSGPQRGLI
jgi:hypothetical protein